MMTEQTETFGDILRQHRGLDELGCYFGDMLCRRGAVQGEAGNCLQVLASLTVKAFREGNSCLDLKAWTARICARAENAWKLTPEDLKAFKEKLEQWKDGLETIPETVMSRNRYQANAPLIWMGQGADQAKIYLNRHFVYESDVVDFFMGLKDNQLGASSDLKEKVHGASSRFGQRDFDQDPQQQAVCHALESRVQIITGGPGTGKTTVLAIALALELQRNPTLRIALCAPTGKASARMKESIDRALEQDLSPDLRSSIGARLADLPSVTLHKLLGLHEGSDYASMNSENPLDADLVVVDECSMMSLQLFSQLLKALRSDARLILLGDPNQLASVDAGNVLAELCAFLPSGFVSRLVTNYRSQKNAALDTFAHCTVGQGTGAPDVAGLYVGTDPSRGNGGIFQGWELPDKHQEIPAALEQAVRAALVAMGDNAGESWRKVKDVETALATVEKFKVLCAVREGACGVIALNELLARVLKIRGPYANGVPIIVMRNDGNSGLKNGDVGVCLNGMVHFRQGERLVSFYPMELPAHERAFAMTIHKSQGSDFENVLMVLPEKDTPILTRELVYTGITRTKTNFTLVSHRDILEQALNRPVERWSGLSQRLG